MPAPTQPTGVQYRRLTGWMMNVSGDPVLGTVYKFEAVPNRVYDTSATPPAIINTDPVYGRFGADHIMRDQAGDEGVWIVDPNDPTLSPTGFNYRVTVEAPGCKAESFNIDIPAGSGDVDLATVMPVDPRLGTPNVQGPQGSQGPPGPTGPPGSGNVNSVNSVTPDGAGDVTWLPTWAQVSAKPAVIAAGATQSAARTAIGAGTGDGTSDLVLGTTAGTALEGDTTAEDIDAATNTGGGREKVAALSATSGTATGNLNNASVFTVTPTGNITLAFSNIPTTGTACTLTVIISMGSTLYTVTMPSGTVWLSGAPTLVASKTAVFTMLTVDGGTTWIASAGVEA